MMNSRPVMVGDVIAATRVLMTLDYRARYDTAVQLFDEARQADESRLRGEGYHPLYGDGSLMAAALAWAHRRGIELAKEPCLSNDDYRETLILMLAVVGEAQALRRAA